MKVQKRDGRIVPYDREKIRGAMEKANAVVEQKDQADRKSTRLNSSHA